MYKRFYITSGLDGKVRQTMLIFEFGFIEKIEFPLYIKQFTESQAMRKNAGHTRIARIQKVIGSDVSKYRKTLSTLSNYIRHPNLVVDLCNFFAKKCLSF